MTNPISTSIRETLREVEQQGHVRVQSRSDSNRHYRVTVLRVGDVLQPVACSCRGGEERGPGTCVHFNDVKKTLADAAVLAYS